MAPPADSSRIHFALRASRFALPHFRALALGALICLAGCAGGGRVNLVSLDLRSIDPPGPRVFEMPFSRCQWWTDEEERLWLAMNGDMRPYFGLFGGIHIEMSIRLEKMPSGKARNYSIATDEVRVRIRSPYSETRLNSSAGILAIYRDDDETLRGTFRIQASRFTLQVLGGWTSGARFLLFGEFSAKPDAGDSAAIVESTEGPGFERGTPTTKPAAVSRPAGQESN